MRPMGPERTELRAEWLLTTQTAASPDYDRSNINIVDFAKMVELAATATLGRG